MTTTTPLLTVEHVRDLADDLIRALAARLGDPDAIRATLLHWTDTLGPETLAVVSMAAVQAIFTDCLTPTPEPLPPGSTSFQQPTQED